MPKNESVQKRDWYLDLVYKDQDFRNDLGRLTETKIKTKYHVTDEEIEFFKSGSFDRGRFINRRDSLSFYTDEEKKEITVKIGRNATFEDFREAWPLIRALKWSMFGQEEKRYRSPDQPGIVYAVYKLRRDGLNRNEIFKLYAGGKLTSSPYDSDHFLTPKDLMDYCRPFFAQIENSNSIDEEQSRKNSEFLATLKKYFSRF